MRPSDATAPRPTIAGGLSFALGQAYGSGMRYDRSRYMPASEVEARFGLAPGRCPFCGSGDVGLYVGPLSHMSCLACGADGPLSEGPTRGLSLEQVQYQALLRWNSRVG